MSLQLLFLFTWTSSFYERIATSSEVILLAASVVYLLKRQHFVRYEWPAAVFGRHGQKCRTKHRLSVSHLALGV